MDSCAEWNNFFGITCQHCLALANRGTERISNE
jgi:hypothetical protein